LSVNKLVEYAASKYAAGQIDNPENWKHRPIFLYAGEKDSIVKANVVSKAAEFYASDFGSGISQRVTTHIQPNAQHAFSTNIKGYGNKCDVLASPYINYCAYDGAGAVLNAIYEDLKPPVDPIDSHIVSIDQAHYVSALGWTAAEASMADKAFLYVPTDCKDDPEKKCRIHVVYHGCQSFYGAVQDSIYVHTGYNNWAESNNILVLYPQTVAKTVVNAVGCWDWYGFLNDKFDTKDGIQIRAVNAMVSDLRNIVTADVVQSQIRDYPRSYHNPEEVSTQHEHGCSSLANSVAVELHRVLDLLEDTNQVVQAKTLLNATLHRMRTLSE
jgi:poly(3-hydroxybutyrate) depolymerase